MGVLHLNFGLLLPPLKEEDTQMPRIQVTRGEPKKERKKENGEKRQRPPPSHSNCENWKWTVHYVMYIIPPLPHAYHPDTAFFLLGPAAAEATALLLLVQWQ